MATVLADFVAKHEFSIDGTTSLAGPNQRALYKNTTWTQVMKISSNATITRRALQIHATSTTNRTEKQTGDTFVLFTH